jgi:hypothetical protein
MARTVAVAPDDGPPIDGPRTNFASLAPALRSAHKVPRPLVPTRPGASFITTESAGVYDSDGVQPTGTNLYLFPIMYLLIFVANHVLVLYLFLVLEGSGGTYRSFEQGVRLA